MATCSVITEARWEFAPRWTIIGPNMTPLAFFALEDNLSETEIQGQAIFVYTIYKMFESCRANDRILGDDGVQRILSQLAFERQRERMVWRATKPSVLH